MLLTKLTEFLKIKIFTYIIIEKFELENIIYNYLII